MSHKKSMVFWVKLALWLILPLPFIRWFVLGYTNQLTANPQEFLIRSSGTWTLVCLWIALSVTPLRILTQQPWLGSVRRLCGLWAYFYAVCHVTLWMWLDKYFIWSDILTDITTRTFITIGAAAFLILSFMALTSYKQAMKLLGKTWLSLHRTVYFVGVLVLAHYLLHLQGKNQYQEPLIYFLVFLALMAIRLPWVRRQFRKKV